jgi:hypothetical protein
LHRQGSRHISLEASDELSLNRNNIWYWSSTAPVALVSLVEARVATLDEYFDLTGSLRAVKVVQTTAST